MLREQGGGVEYNENNFKKKKNNNKGTIQIKVSNSIKRTNLGLSQHPLFELFSYLSLVVVN